MLTFSSLPSTNTWALEHAGDLQHGDVVWARSQTAGRGRLDRSWVAPAGTNLTVSVVLHDAALTPLAANLGQLAACAVVDTLTEVGIKAALKWPNDVMAADGKLGGLLVEQSGRDGLFVLGIGLNVNVTLAELTAAGLDRPVTSMRDLTGRTFDLEEVLRILLRNLGERIEAVRSKGLGLLWEMWGRNDWLSGRRVRVTGPARAVEGTYVGLDRDGRLRIRTDAGLEEVLWTGDVSIMAR